MPPSSNSSKISRFSLVMKYRPGCIHEAEDTVSTATSAYWWRTTLRVSSSAQKLWRASKSAKRSPKEINDCNNLAREGDKEMEKGAFLKTPPC